MTTSELPLTEAPGEPDRGPVGSGVPPEWLVGPTHRYPPSSLVDLTAAQAAATPEAVAVRQWERSLTYRQLMSGASRLARALRTAGVGVESRVVVCTERSPQMVTAVLGVLAAGAAYVPIELAQPVRRQRLLVAEAGARVAVVDEAGRAALADSGLALVPVPDSAAAPEPPDTARPTRTGARPDNAAYVLFTSGSTGRPKGVVVSHRSVVAFCWATAATCRIGPHTRGIGYAGLGFDVSVLDLFPVLLRGGAVQLVPNADRTDPARLQRFLVEHRVTWGYLPPALLPLLDPAQLTELRCVIVAGEASGPEQVARWSAGGRQFQNWYGPTEATVCVTGSELTGRWDRPLPIGRPLPNHRGYILDEQLRPVPPGEPGELYVSGPGLARGYLNRPGQTAERFLPDPFSEQPGARMYRTGDLVTWEPDGRIGFLGRIDRQFKIAGQRVEAGEIEAALRAHPAVAHAVVDVRPGSSGTPELTAYLTPATAPDLAVVREFCADRLPTYMLPHRVVRLDRLPLNASSKVDLVALRAFPAARGPGGEPVGPGRRPATPAQRAVAAAWSRVFGCPEPSLDDDFVAAGGHSLLAMRLGALLRSEQQREFAVDDVFLGRTVEGLARRLEAAAPVEATAVPTDRPAALSAAQRRLWFLDRLSEDTSAYNIAVAERLRGPLDPAALRAALAMVAERQQILRWRVSERDSRPRVVVAAPGAVQLPVVDLTDPGRADPGRVDPGGADADPAAAVRAELRAEASRRFDLARGPLWRARLLRLGPDDHVLALTLHHLIFDGWSLDVLYRDLAACYRAARDGRAVATLPTGYGDYVGWRSEQQDRRGRADLDWWLSTLDGANPVLDLPRDRPRPPVQTHRGERRRHQVPAADAARVRELARDRSTTPYTVLLAGFAALLRRLAGSTDLIVGVAAADRRHPAFDDLVGLFVDVLPVRLRIDDGADFAELVGRCRDAVLAALAHRDAPFERLVDGLRLPRDLSREPLVQVLFNMYNFAEARLDLPGVLAEPLTPGVPGSLVDLTLYVTEQAGGFDLEAVYNPDLYDADRIDALLASYTALLRAVLDTPDAPVGRASARPAGLPLPDPARPLPTRPPVEGVLERMGRMAAERPSNTAVAGAGGRLSYAELDRLRAAVAQAVRSAGAQPGTPVGVLASRFVGLPGVLLGVLSTGGRWLVLDPAYPADRLARLVAAAGVRLLCRCPGVPVPEPLAGLPLVDVSTVDASVTGAVPVPAAQRGYLMSTSGTTGEPAVVITPERPLAAFLDWYAGRFGLGPDDATALLAGLAHDPLLRDALAPLVSGGRICVPEPDWLRDPARLLPWLARERVTVLHLTPQLARLLTAAVTMPGTLPRTLPSVRLAVLAGDQLGWADVVELRRLLPKALLVNGYGCTETPQLQAIQVVDRAAEHDPTPIGHGVPGTELVVVGAGGRPATVGELGEVMVSGPNLADGYTDPALTAARFATNPFRADRRRSGPDRTVDRVYSTGDLGRYRPDGSVVLAGRADDQVKIRGHRVELAEVAAVLAGHPEVAEAAAVTRELAGELAVVAYAVPRRAGVPVAALAEHLRSRLPEHACPAAIVPVPGLPLGPNGKLDRAALPAPSPEPRHPDRGEAAVSRTEKLIAGLWREVLGLPRVSVTDSFFDIGGHSLALVTVQARLAAALGRPIHVVDLFRFPTVRALAAFLDDDRSPAGLERADRRLAARRERLAGNPRHRGAADREQR